MAVANEVEKLKTIKSKIIAPILITIILVLYYIVYFGVLLYLLGGVWKYLLGIIPLIFVAILVKVCIERINEIRKGEENDLSKY